MSDPTPARPRFGVGSVVRLAHFGSGGVMGYDGDGYMILFRGGETRGVAFRLRAESAAGDPEIDRL